MAGHFRQLGASCLLALCGVLVAAQNSSGGWFNLVNIDVDATEVAKSVDRIRDLLERKSPEFQEELKRIYELFDRMPANLRAVVGRMTDDLHKLEGMTYADARVAYAQLRGDLIKAMILAKAIESGKVKPTEAVKLAIDLGLLGGADTALISFKPPTVRMRWTSVADFEPQSPSVTAIGQGLREKEWRVETFSSPDGKPIRDISSHFGGGLEDRPTLLIAKTGGANLQPGEYWIGFSKRGGGRPIFLAVEWEERPLPQLDGWKGRLLPLSVDRDDRYHRLAALAAQHPELFQAAEISWYPMRPTPTWLSFYYRLIVNRDVVIHQQGTRLQVTNENLETADATFSEDRGAIECRQWGLRGWLIGNAIVWRPLSDTSPPNPAQAAEFENRWVKK